MKRWWPLQPVHDLFLATLGPLQRRNSYVGAALAAMLFRAVTAAKAAPTHHNKLNALWKRS